MTAGRLMNKMQLNPIANIRMGINSKGSSTWIKVAFRTEIVVNDSDSSGNVISSSSSSFN